MPLTVAERGQTIATFRYIEVRLMEIAAAWVPTTPEMEVKVLLGKHIWDFAQHADALGKRTFELRLPEHFSQRPSSGYVQLLDDVAAIEDTAHRLAALYEALLPGIERRYLRYVERTDTLLDAPSVVIVERILQDIARQRREVGGLRGEIRLAPTNAEELRRQDGLLDAVVVLRGQA